MADGRRTSTVEENLRSSVDYAPTLWEATTQVKYFIVFNWKLEFI